MKQYRLVDNIFGWVAFIIAAFTYCSTIEPTASFWDCPEFITTAYKHGATGEAVLLVDELAANFLVRNIEYGAYH